MPIVVWFSRLQPDADAQDYERWVEEVDYLGAAEVPSLLSYQVYRVREPAVGVADGDFDYDYVEVAEVTDMQAYLHDLETHPAALKIIAEIGEYVESLGGVWGHAVPESGRGEDPTASHEQGGDR